jgi:LCP family protein required for cell wall assembly
MKLRQIISGLCGLALLAGAGAACAQPTPPPATETSAPGQTLTASTTPSLTASPYSSALRTPRGAYPTAQFTPIITQLPPLSGVQQPEDVRSILLLGVDSLSPYIGRTDAISVFLYSPRLGRGSLLSIPPDLFINLPGYTTQRLNSAYAVGGIELVKDALQYNLGIRPDDYIAVSLESFVYFIDDLGGLEAVVTEKLPQVCSDIQPGRRLLSGDQVMCYLRYRDGMDELNRAQREQEIFRLVVQRMVSGGNLVRLPELYASYQGNVKSSLSLQELLGMIPFALRLGDASHLGLFQISGDALNVWQIPDGLKPSVFLPNQAALGRQVQLAIDFVLTPEPNSARILTLEYELTVSPTPTLTGTPTPSQTASRTIPPTSTRRPSETLTPTPSATITNTPNGSETATLTPNGSETVTPTLTETAEE